jgi:hypothetical protein
MNYRRLKIVNDRVFDEHGTPIAYLNKTDGYLFTVYSERTHLAVTKSWEYEDWLVTITDVKRWIARTYEHWR